jgi:glyoxylase-like metal-dependent hydrolase (beta-lactamase superfamily II)
MHVELLNVGWLTAPAWILRRGEPRDQSIRFPVPAYVVETDEQRILVDTGLHPDAVADASAFYGSSEGLDLFKHEQQLTLAEQIDLDTVTLVVLTHLHWDHAGGLSLLPTSVPVVIQRREWAAGHDRAVVKRNSYFPRDYAEQGRKVITVDGDHDLLGDGSLELLLTPGHTPGHQSVRVGGELVLGADVAYFAGVLDDQRFPVYGDDLAAQGRSAERLRRLRDAGARVIPGHDPDVLRPGTLVV